MRTAFTNSRNDPKAVFYSQCIANLSSRSTRIQEVACQNLEDVLGGFGRSFQILAKRKIGNAYTPENPVIVNTGILTGSSVMTGLRTYFSAYSPIKTSNRGLPGAMWATGSCKFGSKLKWAGIDELILEGRSVEPIILVIRRGELGPEVEFKSARHLIGLACYKKMLALQQEYPDAHFAAIGPAGENYENCYYGAVALSTENLLKTGDDKCRWAGRGGVGSVMGYKNILAIVAQAPDQIEKTPPEIRAINKEIGTGPGSRKLREKDKGGLGGTWCNYAPLEKFYFVPQNNFRPKADDRVKLMFRENVEPEFVVKAESCFLCGIHCHKNIYEKKADGSKGKFLAKFDYEPVDLLSTNLGIDDAQKATELISLVDHLGMDQISIGTTISYILDYNQRHPGQPIFNGATFGDFEKVKELIESTGRGRNPGIGHGVKRLSESLGETGYAMQVKGLELPGYLPDTNPGYAWAIAGGHMSMATYFALANEGNTSVDYWTKAITERGLYWVRDDLIGLCKFCGATPDMVVQAIMLETGLEITPQELLATVRRAFIRALWLERKQGYEGSDYTLPGEVFDRPNDKLGVKPFVTREFFSELSERVWAVFDKEIGAL